MRSHIALVHGRSGDKGNKAIIGVIARRAEDLPLLAAWLTPERVALHFAHRAPSWVERFDLPGLNAIDFVLHDVRALGKRGAALLDPNQYGSPQVLGKQLRESGSWGVIFPSVRHDGGFCVGVFRPKALRNARSGAHIALHWDGTRITHWYEKRGPHLLP